MLSFQHFPIISLFLVKLLWQQAYALGNYSDHLSLLKFKEGITGDPHGLLNSWNDSNPFCSWFGITCSLRHHRVTSMILPAQNLVGTISPYIGNLSFLKVIDLHNNSFHGGIPHEIGRLFRLRQLILDQNPIGGEIPLSIANCSQLNKIILADNKIVGTVPAWICSLDKLDQLVIENSKLVGEIPSCIGNLSALRGLSLVDNNINGSIPEDIGKLRSLRFFYIGANKLSGEIPPSLFNITSLMEISMTENQLYGILPDNMCLTLSNLLVVEVSGNKLFGPIPKSICNCSHLELLEMIGNSFVGQIPNDLGKLQNLSVVGFGQNILGSNSTKDLVFLTSLTNCSKLQKLSLEDNNFAGSLPRIIANLSTQLKYLYLGKNQFSGRIPDTIDNLFNLILLGMDHDLFTGSIPSSLARLSNLQELYLNFNQLSGQIPATLGNLTQVGLLDMSHNKLEGIIPSSIGNCTLLSELTIANNSLVGEIPPQILLIHSLSRYLLLSGNLLTGKVPAEVGKLITLNALDISNNNLTGEIPRAMEGCRGMEYLYLQGNSFDGTIPSSLASLKALKYLDISRNKLTGPIPDDFPSIPFLYLNLSFNDLEGEVPVEGVFKNTSAFSLVGNKKLCGGIPELRLPRCPTTLRKKGKTLASKPAIITTCVVIFVILMLTSFILHRMRKSKKKPATETTVFDQVVRVTYGDLYHATDGFSQNNLIGSGSFGTVYAGFLDQLEATVAIKVLNLAQKGASKSFLAECKVLRNVRHRNLVKLLTNCSSIDYKGNEFKALIFEFMPNGSLEEWLHPNSGREDSSNKLDLLQRLNIAINVATALEHLHNFSESPVVHCDLKPSNVLLDGDMVAHVSDFGLARIFSTTACSSASRSSTIGIKGTIGYAAPEYGTAGVASVEGDAYSFGILVLEMFTGRRPTDEMFKDGFNLHEFVKTTLTERLFFIIDPLVLSTNAVEEGSNALDYDDNGIFEEQSNNEHNIQMRLKMQKCLFSVFEIGLACSIESPKDRMNMTDVTRKLHLIKKDFLENNRNVL